jgi:hypothetical protein
MPTRRCSRCGRRPAILSPALAHLGIFKPAIEKIAEAYKLCSWHEQFEEAATAKELHDLIALSRGHE